MSAIDLARRIRTRELSAREVTRAHLDRIAEVNPAINAIVAKLDDDRCLALADEADARLVRGEPVGPLHGLPFAFKDLEDAIGFPATKGSPIFKDFTPAADSAVVACIRSAGVIPIGKTNVPEFGMGSHTYNKVYGTTRNPYDVSKTAGGSSGGAGAALAAGLVPLADGSDLGGSLRNPGNFNNIVGFRPSPGLVPSDPDTLPGLDFSVKGPMGRTVEDVAFFFDVLTLTAGALSASASARSESVASYGETPPKRPEVQRREGGPAAPRLAWSLDLGGLPVDRRVREVLEPHRKTFESLGCRVEDACPDLTDADEIFLTFRRLRSFHKYGALLDDHRREMKPEAIDEIERGARVTAADVAQATAQHEALQDRLRRFFDRYDFIACVVNQVPPFDIDVDWPRAIDGVAMETYTDWMKSAYWISVTHCPAISIPAGFTTDTLPVGIQLVGRRLHDRAVLELAHSFERALTALLPRVIPVRRARN